MLLLVGYHLLDSAPPPKQVLPLCQRGAPPKRPCRAKILRLWGLWYLFPEAEGGGGVTKGYLVLSSPKISHPYQIISQCTVCRRCPGSSLRL